MSIRDELAFRRTAFGPGLVLVLVAAVWGSSFFMTKDIITRIPPLDFLGERFAVAGLAGGLLLAPRLRRADRGTWWRGIALGAVYSVGQVTQTYGLSVASASVSGFLTALYVVGTPLVAFLVFRTRLAPSTLLAVVLAISGAAVLGLHGLHLGRGELALVACALAYSVHVVALGRWSVGRDPLVLGTVQMLSLGVIHLAVAAPTGFVLPRSAGDWGILVYLAVVVGLAALIGQTWAQGRMSAARAAVIMSLEPVFASIFAIAWGGESLTARLLLGGGLVLAGTVLAEVGPPRPLGRRLGRWERGVPDRDAASLYGQGGQRRPAALRAR